MLIELIKMATSVLLLFCFLSFGLADPVPESQSYLSHECVDAYVNIQYCLKSKIYKLNTCERIDTHMDCIKEFETAGCPKIRYGINFP